MPRSVERRLPFRRDEAGTGSPDTGAGGVAFLLGQSLPLVLLVLGFLAPKLADDFGYLRIREARVVHSDLALVVLTV